MMGNKEKSYSMVLISIILFLFFSTLISSGALASAVQDNQFMINETQITTNESDQYYPNIYRDRIVWTDSRNESWEIHMYDLSTSREIQITTNSSHSQSPACPAIYGNRIVWENERNGNKDIYMYTVSVSAGLVP